MYQYQLACDCPSPLVVPRMPPPMKWIRSRTPRRAALRRAADRFAGSGPGSADSSSARCTVTPRAGRGCLGARAGRRGRRRSAAYSPSRTRTCPLPRDLDRRIRAVCELHGPDERGHPVGQRPLAVVEEDPDPLRPERQHLGLQTREIRRRAADVREYVLVELPAEAVEVAEASVERQPELRRRRRHGRALRRPGRSRDGKTGRDRAAERGTATRATPKRRPGGHPATHVPSRHGG